MGKEEEGRWRGVRQTCTTMASDPALLGTLYTSMCLEFPPIRNEILKQRGNRTRCGGITRPTNRPALLQQRNFAATIRRKTSTGKDDDIGKNSKWIMANLFSSQFFSTRLGRTQPINLIIRSHPIEPLTVLSILAVSSWITNIIDYVLANRRHLELLEEIHLLRAQLESQHRTTLAAIADSGHSTRKSN